MKKLFTLTLCIGLQGSGLLLVRAQSVGLTSRSGEDTSSAIVQLKGDPLSVAAVTKPPQGKKIDFSSAIVKSYRAQLSAIRNDFKAWLNVNAPNAKVTGQFDISLNAVSLDLNGTSLDAIRKAPQVLSAEYEGLYSPVANDPDLGLIQAIAAWQVGGGSAHAGEGVKVAMIDTGIDIHHPCFSDAGYPAQKQLGDPKFTNNKVIAARVFYNKNSTFHYTAEAVQDHGTHTAGTVGCNYNTPAVVSGVSIPYGVSGVAPRVLLGNYNVFPGPVANARSEDIFQALESAYEDGFDVANMSLGGGYHGVQTLLDAAVNHLDEADMVVAVAAGNSGPGFQTIQSPGSAARALTAGASTVPHYIGAPVTVNGRSLGAAVGDFALASSNLTAVLAVVSNSSGGLGLGCDALPAGNLAGKIALISRGSCSFSTKIRNAQAAGAVAALLVNNVAGDAIAMGQDGTTNQPTIPAYMFSQADGMAVAGSAGASVTISATLSYFLTTNPDFMAGFSGQGPTLVDFRIKPDVVAPGVNVLSSIPNSFCGGSPCWAFFQGTSMATPHLAGGAAIIRWLYPNWSAAQIRSAIVNTADQGVLKQSTSTSLETAVNIIGSGRENLLAAANAVVALDPVSVSFGAVPSGSGQTQPLSVSLNNLSSAAASYSLAVSGGDSAVAYSVNPASLSLKPGQSGTVTVTMSAVKGAPIGSSHQGKLKVSVGSVEVAHAAIYTLIK